MPHTASKGSDRTVTNPVDKSSAKAEAAAASRELMRRALKGTLATLDRASGEPYASLVTLATDVNGTPLLLISRLAWHTQNLLADGRASILIDGTGAEGDPLAGGRVTLIGRVARTESETARRRFLARHPAAQVYADFPDFGFFKLEIERAHYIGGFGRIVDLQAPDLLLDITGAEKLVASEADIIEHMNSDHSDAVAAYASSVGAPVARAWTMTGLDPEGCDIVALPEAARIVFSQHVTTAAEARKELVRLVNAARTN
jgi:heme iron utilization protein